MMRIGRLPAVLVVVSVLASTVFGAGIVAGAGSNSVFISVDTTTSPDQPTTEDEFDLEATITSASASTGNAYISRISLVNTTDEDREKKRYDTIYGAGQVSPGSSLSETLSVELDEEGVHELYLDLTVRSGDRVYHVYEPVTIEVYDGHPVVDAQAAESFPGEFTDLEVTLGNGLDERIRNVELTLNSAAVDIEQPRRVVSLIGAEETRAFTFRAKVPEAGEKEVQATIRYTDGDGERRHVTRTLAPAFTAPELGDDVSVAGEVAPSIPGASTTLNLTVSNGLDVSLRQLRVTVQGEGVDIPNPQRVSGRMESGDTRDYRFSVQRETNGQQPFKVELAYVTANGASRTVTRTVQTAFRQVQNPGDVSLTGLDVQREGETLAISGTASNVGGGAVSGVTISVGSNDDVLPGRSESEFFVGTIPESDFVSFDVNARLETNTSSAQIPLEVSYTVEGVRQTKPVTVQYEAEAQPSDGPSNGGLPVLPIVGGVLVLVIIVAVIGYLRR